MTSVAFAKKMRHKTHFPLESDQDQMVVKSVSIPVGLEILMEGLTKEVLRVQPEDICLFASQHFARLIKVREAYESNLKVNKIIGNVKERVKSANIHKKAKAEEDGSKNSISHIKSETTNFDTRGNETSRSEASTAEFDKLHASSTIEHQNENQEVHKDNDEGTANSVENLHNEYNKNLANNDSDSSNTISNENGHITSKIEMNEINEINSHGKHSTENQSDDSDVQATQAPDRLATVNEINENVSPEDTSNNIILESETSKSEENNGLDIQQEKQNENEDISTNTKDKLVSEENIEDSHVSELKTDEIVAPNEDKENVSSEGTSNTKIESEPSNTAENNVVDIQPKTEYEMNDISTNTKDKQNSEGNNEFEDSDVQALKTDKMATPNEIKENISSEGTSNNKILESEPSKTEENNITGIQQQKQDENEDIPTNTKDKLESEGNDLIEDSDVQALKIDKIVAPNETEENVSSEGTSNSKILESDLSNTEENNVLDTQQEKQDENEDIPTNPKHKLDSEENNKIEDSGLNVVATNKAENVHDSTEETDMDNILERSNSTEKNKDLEQKEQNKNENLPPNIKDENIENDDIQTVSFEKATEKKDKVSGNSEDKTPGISTDTELRNSSDTASNDEKQDNDEDISDDKRKEESMKIEAQANDEKLTQAATKIQSVWRGYSYRKQNKVKDVEGNLSGINADIVSHTPVNIAQLSATQQKIKEVNENNEIQKNELVLEETSQSSNRTPPAEEKEEAHISETVDENNLITPVPISTTTINDLESISDNDVMHETNSLNLKDDNTLPDQIQQEESTEEQHSEEKTKLISEEESLGEQENSSDKEANIDKKNNAMDMEESTEKQHSEEIAKLNSEKESSEQQENTSDKEANIDKKNNNMNNIVLEEIQQEESTEEQHSEEKTKLISGKESLEEQENTSDKEANIDKKNDDMDNTNKILNNVKNTENISQNNLENKNDSSDIANHSNSILSLQPGEISEFNSETSNNEQKQENFISENKLDVDMNQELKDKKLPKKTQNNLEANENSEKNNYRLNTKESEENKESALDEKEIMKEDAVIVSSVDIKNYEHIEQEEETNLNSDNESTNMEEDKNKETRNIQDSKTKDKSIPIESNKNESKEDNPNSSEVNSEYQKQAKESNLLESPVESTDSKTDETTAPENSPNVISETQNSYMNEEKKTITDETTESTININKPDSQEDKKAADTNISQQNSVETNSEYLGNDTPEKHVENISEVAVPEKCQETEKTSTSSTENHDIYANNDNTEKQEVKIQNTGAENAVPEVNNEEQTNKNDTHMVENYKDKFIHLIKETEKKVESQESINQLSPNKGEEISGPLVENTEKNNKILTNEDSNILTSSDDSKPSINKESEEKVIHDEEKEHLIESKTTEASNISETSLQEQSSSEKKTKDELNVKPNEERMLEEQNTSTVPEPDIKNIKNSTEKEETVVTKPDDDLKGSPALLTKGEDNKTSEDLDNNDSSTEVNVIPTNLKNGSKKLDLNSEKKEDLFNTRDENQNITEDNNDKIILETTINAKTPSKEDVEVNESNSTIKDTAESKNSDYKPTKEEQHVDVNNQEDGQQNEIQNEEKNDTVSVLVKTSNENNEKDLNEEHNISETSNENKTDFQKNVDSFESAVLEDENLEKLKEDKGEEKDISNSESYVKVPGTNIDNSAITKTEQANLKNKSKNLTNLPESNETENEKSDQTKSNEDLKNEENKAYEPIAKNKEVEKLNECETTNSIEKTEANIINDKTVSEINHTDEETHNNEETNNTILELKASEEENELQSSESNKNEVYEPNQTKSIIQKNDDNGTENYNEENNEVFENSYQNETAKSEDENKKDIENVMVVDKEKHLDEKESDVTTEANKTEESSSDAPKKSEETVESETENKDHTNLDNTNDNEYLQNSTEENEVKLDKNKLEYTNLQYTLVKDSDNKTKEDAAVKIQHAWRYFNKKRSLQYMDKLQKPAECDELSEQRGEEDDAKILKAAVLLQAGVRGFLSRKKFAAPRKSSEDGISENLTKSSTTTGESQSSNFESTLAREDTLEMDDKDTLQNISTDMSSESTTSSLPNSENTVRHFDRQKATSTDLDESETELETDKKVTDKTEKEDIRVTNTNVKKEESVHTCTTNILPDDSKLNEENTTVSLHITDDLSNIPVVEEKHTTHESSEPKSTNQIKEHLEDKSMAISKQQGINFDDFDSSKYDLKQEHKSTRSRSSTPISELSSAAYKIGAAIATNNDKIINAIDGEPEEKVEYIHIPLHDPTAEKSKTESVQEIKSSSEVSASKKELSNLKNKNESSPEYIYIPLKPVTSSTYKENDEKDDTNVTTVEIEHNTNNEQYISNTEINEKPQLEANKVNLQRINTGKHEGNSSSTESNEGSITPLPHPASDIDSFNRDSKLSTTNKQDSISASSNRKILDEIDAFIKTYEQKRQISPNNSNHEKLDQGLISNDITNKSLKDKSISSEKNSAATKIQSLYRGYSTRKNLKMETDKKKLEEQSNKNRRNSSDTDKTYIIEKRSHGSESTPDDISSDEETRNIAASKIQNSYRNYRRKRETVLNVGQPLQNIDNLEYKHPSSPDVTSHVIKQEELKDPLELAATKIQRNYRIYKNRQSLAKNNSECSVLQTIPELSCTSQTDSKMYSKSSVNEEKTISGPVTSASAAQEENFSGLEHTANHLTTSLDNKSTKNSVTSEKLDKTGITHKQFPESYIQEKSATASSVLSTDRNIQTETDTSNHDSVDYKIAEKIQHVADDKNENMQRMVEPGLLHSGEMHDSIDIFLSSEELSQGAEKLTSQPAPVPHDRRDVGSLSTAAEPAQTQGQLSCAPNSAPRESLHHHFVMEAAESKEAQSQSTNMGIASTEQEAATKIQAGFRGYQVRKQMKLKKNGSEDAKTVKRSSSGRRKVSQRRTENQSANAKPPSDLEERSATKIQAGIRGFLVRKRQKNIKNEES